MTGVILPTNDTTQSPAHPGKPTGLTATASGVTNSIDVAWTDVSAGAASFEILRSTDGVTYAWIANNAAADVTYTNTGLAWETQYYYKVRALQSGAYSELSAADDATTIAEP